jgi:hypothetical protein
VEELFQFRRGHAHGDEIAHAEELLVRGERSAKKDVNSGENWTHECPEP